VQPRAKSQLAEYPPAFPGLAADDLDLKDGFIFEKRNPENRMSLADFIGPSGAQGPLTGTAGEPLFNTTEEALAYPLRGTPPLFEPGWHLQRGCYIGVRLRFCRQAYFMESGRHRDGPGRRRKVVTVNDVGKVINWDGCGARPAAAPSLAIGRA
jgi:hypothetical protein